jgi:hypothetical protein
VEHEIKTLSNPPFGLIYNLSSYKLSALHAYINTTLKKGWIRHLISLVEAPILFIFKKDKGLRLYVNYYVLNKVIRKNHLAILLISEILDQLIRVTHLSKINLKDTYYHILVVEKDC